MKTTNQLIVGKSDYSTIMTFLTNASSRTLFNRYDAAELLAEIKKARILDDNKLPVGVIRLNSTVKLRDEDQQKVIELTLVTPKRANIKERKISVMSPIGIALLGYTEGQMINWKVPLGIKHFKVLAVNYDPE